MKKVFKKNLLFSSFVVLIGLGFTAMSYGAAVVSVTPDQISSPAVGEQLEFSIEITGAKGVAGYKLTIGFDPTALRYIDSTNGDYLPTGTFVSSIVPSANGVSVAATAPTGVASLENGTLTTVKFEVVAVKSSTIQLVDVTLFDSAAMPLPVMTVDGTVVATLLLAVDVNQDGTVNIVDLTLVAQNLGTPATANPRVDVNGDGNVNILDMVLVSQNFGEVIPPTEPVVPTPIVPPNIALDAVATAEAASPAVPQAGIVPPVPSPVVVNPWDVEFNPPNSAAFDDVFFQAHGTNPFIDTEDDAFSTFGMDVDTASYAITRRYLRDGYLPPPEAVRVEEFVNAFDYNYTPPSDETFAIHLEGAPSKFGEGKRLQLLRIGIQGYIVPDRDRKDAKLTFVIDVSGSMNRENRLELVKRALTLLVDQLRPTDEIGIVIYGSTAQVVLPHTRNVNREHILAAIHSLSPGGATNAEHGLRLGYELALQNFGPDYINRVILCSDGVANVGQTGPDAILTEIGNYVKDGILLTTVGFGMGNYNDILMEQLANKGNGSYAYVDTVKEAERIFVENLTGTLQVIAKDSKVQVEFNPQTVSRFRLLGYENRRLAQEDFRDDDVDAGEIGSGHSVTALYEIKLHEEEVVGKLATVFIRHEDPDTGNVTEVSQDIFADELKGTFEEASTSFQLAATVAEFAEILRGSYWALQGSLNAVEQTLEGIFPFTHQRTEQQDELITLVRQSIRFQ
ncbi:MAG: von Willebrand factor type A domain-containing protein [Candidatus Poribacteria bacterium]|nr:von Willebrand factor type A domain-containing protein [Candidatus Poribacteria bacterium]